MLNFTTSYFLLCFVASIAVIQIGASFGRLEGLLFVKSQTITRVLGVVVVIGSFVWFFSTGERNINDYQGGLDANAQALYFFLGALSGGVFTFLVSSLINHRMFRRTPSPVNGLEALKETHYIRALFRNISYWRRNWSSQIKKYFTG
jgi:hypothetical protein